MNKTKKKSRMEKGITLVALIITIIVLLILAMVTINAVMDDGIIRHAKHATNEYEKKTDEENTILDSYLAKIEENIPGGKKEEETIGKAEVNKIADKNSTIDGKVYSRTNPIIPAGFMPINATSKDGEAKWDATTGPEVDEGLVISDGNSEFVWVPLTEGKTIAAYGVGTDGDREPDVVIQESDSSLNLKDGSDNNPTNLGKINAILNTNYQNSNDFKEALTDDFNSMAVSVNKYGGFYVGRYEMSLAVDKTAQSKYGETSSNAENADTETWYGLYARAKTYTNPAEKTSVKSSMIWGSQYDEMIIWMGDVANEIIQEGRNSNRITGTAENDVIKNVYDLHGNSREWTLEARNTHYRVFRGGYYYGSYSPSCDNYGYPMTSYSPTYKDAVAGTRIALYIV